MRLLLSCSILLLALLPSQAKSAPPDMLEFLAAQQKQYSAVYAKLSYNATVETRGYDPSFGREITQKYRYQIFRRENTVFLTRETDKVRNEIEQYKNGKKVDSLFIERRETMAQRMLVTDEFLAYWANVAVPEIQLYRANDWSHEENGYQQRKMPLMHVVDITTNCFGALTPFHELIQDRHVMTDWKIEEETADRSMITRWLLQEGKEPVQEESFLVDNQHGGVVYQGRFTPNGIAVTLDIEYATLDIDGDRIRVPQHYKNLTLNEKGEIDESIEICFDGFQNQTALQAYSFVDLEAPEGSVIQQMYPLGKMRWFTWKGGEFREFSGPENRSIRPRI